MPSDRPWATDYVSDDPAVKAEQAKTKKLKLNQPPKELGSPKPPKATDAWADAGKFAKRNQLIEQGTRRLRKMLPGQGS